MEEYPSTVFFKKSTVDKFPKVVPDNIGGLGKRTVNSIRVVVGFADSSSPIVKNISIIIQFSLSSKCCSETKDLFVNSIFIQPSVKRLLVFAIVNIFPSAEVKVDTCSYKLMNEYFISM